MTVKLLHNTPLWVCSTAIRKCWASEDKSDTLMKDIALVNNGDGTLTFKPCKDKHPMGITTGALDKALILRVGNKNKHASTLEHLNYSFDIDGISRACLQELARHRHASMSVKSTRYTLKELRDATDEELPNYLVSNKDRWMDDDNLFTLKMIRKYLKGQKSNDQIKYMLPEAYKTSLVWTINARSLQNFLALRTNKAALWEIQELAYEIYDTLPQEHKYLFEEFLYEDK